ncbi:MAG: hypothetical protein ACT4QC_16475 [Planctomycetaceae bacterium]
MRVTRNSSQRRSIPVRCLLVAVALWAIYGCDSATSEYENREQSRASAQDALKAQGARISLERIPLVKAQAYVVDLSGVEHVTDETFAMLQQLQTGKAVLELNLSGTGITDEQIPKLNDKEVSGPLMRLKLRDTMISDKGLGEITGMPALIELDLKNTKVTAEGVKAFQKARAEDPSIQAKKPKILR